MSTPAEALARLVGHPVPAALLAVYANFPQELLALAAKAGFAPHEQFLYPDLETMLAANEEVRAEDIWTEEGPWPGAYLDIGADIGGDRFALNLEETPPRVHRLHHDEGAFEPLCDGLEAYVAALLRLARGEARGLTSALRTT